MWTLHPDTHSRTLPLDETVSWPFGRTTQNSLGSSPGFNLSQYLVGPMKTPFVQGARDLCIGIGPGAWTFRHNGPTVEMSWWHPVHRPNGRDELVAPCA
jgi:hypothetical protein